MSDPKVESILTACRKGALDPQAAHDELAAYGAGNTRLQNIVCAGIPIYNIFASMEGWPQIPLPAFCTAPAPTPTPAS